MNKKKELGIYYTSHSPFDMQPFKYWLEEIEGIDDEPILEPFCGMGHIPKAIGKKWVCYDIDPAQGNVCDFEIKQRDCIEDYPKGFKLAITNPPYLSKASASRQHLDYKYPEYPDLYLKCLEVMLANTPYVAAILPASFITNKCFKERLNSVISLEYKVFDDTECPVCLAMFGPEKKENFWVFSNEVSLGPYKYLKRLDLPATEDFGWTFNKKGADLGMVCIDGQNESRIRFIRGEDIDDDKIKESSRSITKIDHEAGIPDLDLFIDSANKILDKYRRDTRDVLLTSFKGLRKDGRYRRRIRFSQVRGILNETLKTY